MRVLLLSGTGLLGSYLKKNMSQDFTLYSTYRRISNVGDPTKEFYCDLTNDNVRTIIKAVEPDVILLAAANPKTKFDNGSVTSMVNDNIFSVANICSYTPSGTHIIYYSSVLVYGDTKTKASERTYCKPTSIYATTKLAAENILKAYEYQDRIKLTIFRLSQLVGPNLRRGLMYDVINKIKGPNSNIDLFGNCPGSLRPLTHLEDVERCTFQAIESGMYGTYNLCSNDSMYVEDIARTVMDTYGVHKGINWVPDAVWKGDNEKILINNDKIIKDFGELYHDTARDIVKKVAQEN